MIYDHDTAENINLSIWDFGEELRIAETTRPSWQLAICLLCGAHLGADLRSKCSGHSKFGANFKVVFTKPR
jgi:hypothetical protein